jgi:hypothetical protein
VQPQYNTPWGDSQGNIGGFKGGFHGGRGFGGGRGPMTCHNYHKLRKYARYCHVVDHDTKYSLTLLIKI